MDDAPDRLPSPLDGPLSVFDESPTGPFTIAMRGYDRIQVERHIRHMEAALAREEQRAGALEQQIVRLRTELAGAHTQLREVDRPSYSGLGARIEQLLRLAEEQSSDVMAQAEA